MRILLFTFALFSLFARNTWAAEAAAEAAPAMQASGGQTQAMEQNIQSQGEATDESSEETEQAEQKTDSAKTPQEKQAAQDDEDEKREKEEAMQMQQEFIKQSWEALQKNQNALTKAATDGAAGFVEGLAKSGPMGAVGNGALKGATGFVKGAMMDSAMGPLTNPGTGNTAGGGGNPMLGGQTSQAPTIGPEPRASVSSNTFSTTQGVEFSAQLSDSGGISSAKIMGNEYTAMTQKELGYLPDSVQRQNSTGGWDKVSYLKDSAGNQVEFIRTSQGQYQINSAQGDITGTNVGNVRQGIGSFQTGTNGTATFEANGAFKAQLASLEPTSQALSAVANTQLYGSGDIVGAAYQNNTAFNNVMGGTAQVPSATSANATAGGQVVDLSKVSTTPASKTATASNSSLKSYITKKMPAYLDKNRLHQSGGLWRTSDFMGQSYHYKDGNWYLET